MADPFDPGAPLVQGDEPRVQYVGELDPSLSDTLKVDGVPQNLTGCTVKFRMRAIGSSTLKVDAAATVVNAAAGTVRYDWASADIDTAGFYLGWWVVTFADTDTQSKPEFLLDIRAHAPTVGWLVELEECRQSQELSDLMHDLDEQIEQLIPVASEAIITEVWRELVPPAVNPVARTFRSDGRIFEFGTEGPFDLRSASSVVLDPNDQAQTLNLNSDYKLHPYNDRWGVFGEVRLSKFLSRVSNTIARYGFAEITVTGTWGFAAVPQIAKQATFITIRAWLEKASVGAAYVDPDLGGPAPVPGTYAVPPAARNLLRPLYRKSAL